MAKILIAEDDGQIRTAYVYAFTRAGYEVTEAADGGQAMQLLPTVNPDIVLLDMLMPGVSGLDFLRQTNMAGVHPDIKVIAFSNIDTPRVIDEAKQLGAVEYLIKVDVTPHEMVEIANRYLDTPAKAV